MGEQVDFLREAPTTGDLDVMWIHGTPWRKPANDPPIQVHHYDEHTVIMRQSKSVHFEAPFIFLLFGNDRALLLDSGATADPAAFPIRETVDALIATWLQAHPRKKYELIVAHTHGHGDHVAGDVQFTDRPATQIVAKDEQAVRDFFGFTAWPDQTVTYDLGGRILDVIGSPGHQPAAITVYDRWTGILFTGDTVLPARLYARDFPAFVATLERIVAFGESRPVSHALGCHIEMTSRPGKDYPLAATYQPDEHRYQMTFQQLVDARDAAKRVAGKPGVHRFDDFIIYNGAGIGSQLRLLARGWAYRIRRLTGAG